MLKLWYKTIKGDKIIHSEIREFDRLFNEQNFIVQLRDVCNQMNISTPILLKTHFRHLQSFNIVHFRRDDFIDSEDFDKLDVEIVRDKKKK